jgi:nitrate reductase NapE component
MPDRTAREEAPGEIRTSPAGFLSEAFALFPILTLAAVLSFSFLGSKSLWLDEAGSVTSAQRDLPGLLQEVRAGDGNMSLYFLLLHFWLKGGVGEAAARSLSAVTAVATIPLFYVICRRLFGKTHALVASALLAVNGFLIQYAQEARSYSLVVLLVIASSALFLEGVEKRSAANWLLYVVVSSLAVYAHFFAGFVVLAHFLFAVLCRRDAIKAAASAHLAIGVLISPLLLLVASASKETWIRKPRALALLGVFEDLSGRGGKVLFAAYFLSCCLALYAGWTRRGDKPSVEAYRSELFVLAWLATPVLASFAYSHLRQPVFVPRYLIVALPPLVMLVAQGVLSVRRRPLRILLFGALMALSGRAVLAWYGRGPNEDWRSAAGYVLSSTKVGDILFFYKPYVRVPFEYYCHLSGLTARSWPLFPPVGNTQEWLSHQPLTTRRLWLILSHTGDGGDYTPLPIVRSDFSRRRDVSFLGVRVLLYAR